MSLFIKKSSNCKKTNRESVKDFIKKNLLANIQKKDRQKVKIRN